MIFSRKSFTLKIESLMSNLIREPICQTYIADGGEEYITIGNFGSTESTDNGQSEKAKRNHWNSSARCLLLYR